MNFTKAVEHYAAFMHEVGIPVSPHSKDTPRRVVKMYGEYTEGLRPPTFKFTSFPKNPRHTYDQLVVVSPISFGSLCAHHHVPFVGACHVGYLPSKRIIGLSKIVRAVTWISRKPSIQEDLTEEIADLLMMELKPRAVLVMMIATHYCIEMRGAEKAGVKTTTHCIRGRLRLSLKNEFIQTVRKD